MAGSPRRRPARTHPFLFTQSQAIHARSWIPLQDTPQVRMTYAATIRVPAGLRAVMSADTRSATKAGALAADGVYRFDMPQAIPSYLHRARASGELEFRATGPRTGVYAERSVLEAAAKRVRRDLSRWSQACEKLFGPYRWGRYDLLILPPSFPFGGMENPRLSFITPTVIAGDRSLVALIAHELAHSWSGQPRDQRHVARLLAQRRIHGLPASAASSKPSTASDREAMEDVLGLHDPCDESSRATRRRTRVLAIDLRGRDPDDAFTQIPYVKGALVPHLAGLAFRRATTSTLPAQYFDHFAVPEHHDRAVPRLPAKRSCCRRSPAR